MSTARIPRRTTKLSVLALLTTLLWLVPSHAVPPAVAAGPYLYMPSYGALPGKLVVSDLSGASPVNQGTLGGNLNGPTGIALDVKNQQMYIANYFNDTVIRANLNGSSPVQILDNTALNRPMGVALDLANGKIYVANYNGGNVVKANLDGSGAVKLTLGDMLTNPFAVALDTYNNRMYATGLGGQVVTATLDGASPTALTFGSVTITSPAGIAIDVSSSKMYITDFANNHLIQSNWNGGEAIDLGSLGSPLTSGASGVAVDHQNNKLYIMIRATEGKLVRTDLDGGNATELSVGAGWSGLLNYAYFVALDSPPDVTAFKFHSSSGGIPAGSGFDWRLIAYNYGPNPAVYAAGQSILRDYLPAGPTYSVATPEVYGVTTSGPILCSIASNVLNCAEGGGTASFAPGYSSMVVTIKVLTNAVGTLANPSGGMCRADPDLVTGDTNTVNNDCSDSIAITAPNTARGQKLYVVNNSSNAVSRANLDGTGGTSLGNPGAVLHGAQAIALDLAHEKMYLVGGSLPGHVVRANLDATGGTDLGNPGSQLDYPTGITLDVTNNWMYVSNRNNNKIVRADLDGGSASMLADLTGTVNGLSAIALDLVHSRIYVTGNSTHNVYWLNLDGTGGTNLGNVGSLLNYPRGIAVDAVNNRIYVTSQLNSKVVRANLDGTDVTDLGNLGGLCSSPTAVALAANMGQIYVTCLGSSYRIVRANLDGGSAQNLGNLNSTLAFPQSIALDTRAYEYLPLLKR